MRLCAVDVLCSLTFETDGADHWFFDVRLPSAGHPSGADPAHLLGLRLDDELRVDAGRLPGELHVGRAPILRIRPETGFINSLLLALLLVLLLALLLVL